MVVMFCALPFRQVAWVDLFMLFSRSIP